MVTRIPDSTDVGPGVTARARRRPADRRSATVSVRWPPTSVVVRMTDVPRSKRATRVPKACSATASAASSSGGRVTTTTTGSAVGPSISRTINSPLWAVAGQWTHRRLSPGR